MINVINNLKRHRLFKRFISVFKKFRVTILSIFFLFVLSGIFTSFADSDLKIFSALIFYILCILIYRLKSRLTFIFCLVILLIMYVEFILSPASVQAEKAGVWFVLFLLIGIIQQWKE